MLEATSSGEIGKVEVFTSTNGGHSSEQLAEMALNKIMQINESTPSPIKEQALAFRNDIKRILVYYMSKMAQSERTTIWALLRKQGHEDMAEIIRRL